MHAAEIADFPGTERFQVLRKLGAGGAGVVYEVLDRERGERVALKTLKFATARGIPRLKAEFRALADVVHPNLVRLYELIGDGDRWFFTMELVEGWTLSDHIRALHGTALPDAPTRVSKSSAPPANGESDHPPLGRSVQPPLRELLRQLVRGVRAIHRAGLLHRDLKPSNVMITPEGRVMILDFGLAVDARAEGASGARSYLLGTPAYVSPEQVQGLPATRKSDWYMVGALLYESLTGTTPFAGPVDTLLEDKLLRDPPSAIQLAPDAPIDLADLAGALLHRTPQDRPTGEEVLARLGEAPDGRDLERPDADVPFVGRGVELAALGEALQTSRHGPVVALLGGPSGIGKTTLAEELLADTARRSTVLRGRCYERESVSFKAVDGIIDALAEHLATMPVDDATALLPEDVFALARVFPVLRRAPAVATAPGPRIPDPQELRRRAFGALAELIRALAAHRPLVLFIDDLQWADVDSVPLLASLLNAPLLLLATFRSDHADSSPFLNAFLPLIRTLPTRVFDIPVRPLAPQDVHVLARAARRGPIANEDVAAIVAQAEGSPLFVRELVRLREQRGGESGTTPLRLDDAISARVAQLPLEARSVLEILAVAGEPVRQSVALEAAEITRGDDQLVLLRAQNLVRSQGARRGDLAECYHDRVREAVVRGLTTQRRQACHAALAMRLATAGGDLAAIGQHWEQAGELEEASRWLAHAAEQAEASVAFDRAARLWDRVADLGIGDRGHALLRRARALALGGRGAESADAYLLAADARPSEAARLRRRAAEERLLAGHIEAGLEALAGPLATFELALPASAEEAIGQAMPLFAELGARGFDVTLRREAAMGSSVLERIDTCWSVALGLTEIDLRSMPFVARHAAFALDAGEPQRIVRGLSLLVENLSLAFGPHPTLDPALAVLERLRDPSDPHGEGFIHLALGAYHCVADPKLPTAVDHLRASEAAFLAVPGGVSRELGLARAYVAHLETHLGRFDFVARALPPWLEDAHARNDVFAGTWLRLTSHKLWLAQNDPDRADAEFEAARRAWPSSSEGTFDALTFLYGVDLARYRSGTHGWEMVDAGSERFLTSAAAVSPVFHGYLFWQRAAAALGAAAEGGPRRSALHEESRRAIAQLETAARRWHPWQAVARMLAGALADAEGRTEDAARELRAATSELDALGYAGYAPAIRRRLGQVLGGAEGEALVVAADEALRALGVRSPALWTAFLLPGPR